MDRSPAISPDDPKDSADNLDNINEEDVDQSRSTPVDDEGGGGPSVSDAFRSGS